MHENKPIKSHKNAPIIAKEAMQVNFMATEEIEQLSKEDKLKAVLAELFIRSLSINLHHLKPLYVTTHIKGYSVSKIFVHYEATVNIMPISILKALRRSNDELIPSRMTMSSFIGDKSQTKGVLPLEVTIAGQNHITEFFIVDSKTEYNALLARTDPHRDQGGPRTRWQS